MRNYFKAWRTYRGLTQIKAAEATGLTQGHVSFMEKGRRGFTSDTLAKLCETYRAEPWELLGYDPAGQGRDRLLRVVADLPDDKVELGIRLLSQLEK